MGARSRLLIGAPLLVGVALLLWGARFWNAQAGEPRLPEQKPAPQVHTASRTLRANQREASRQPAPRSSELTGRVVDAEGKAALAEVRLWRVGAWDEASASTDARGSFLFSELAPGKYEAWALSDDGDSARAKVELPNGGGSLLLRFSGAGALATGVVRDLAGGIVVGAEVRVAHANAGLDQTVGLGLTDDQGQYRIRLPAGAYLATARARSYGRARAVLHVGADGGRRDFALRPSASISGHVSRSDGSSPKGAALVLRPARFGGLEAQWPTPIEVASNGEFSANEVSPGRYLLFASTAEESAAFGPFDLAPGEEKRDVRLVVDEGQRLRGTVSTQGGQPIAGAVVTVQQNDAGVSSREIRVETNEQGAFSVGGLFAEHTTTVIAVHSEYGEKIESLGKLERAPKELRLALPAAVTYSGHVVSSEGRAVAGARVWAELPDGQGRVLMQSVSSQTGAFTLRLPPAVNTEQGIVVRARHETLGLGSATVGERSPSIQVVLETGLYVEGKVVDAEGQPAPFARVVATQASPRRPAAQATVLASAGGDFKLGPFEPGVVVVELAAPLGGIGSGQRAEVELQTGQVAAAVELRAPIRSARIEGQVVDAHGPVPDAVVTIAPAGAGFASIGDGTPALTDATGRFVYEELTAGPHRVFVEASGYAPLSRSVDAPATLELQLTLEGNADTPSDEAAVEQETF